MKRLIVSLTLLFALSLAGVAWAQFAVPKADVSVTGSATLISAASSQRVALSCTNTSATVHVRWGDATVTATTGQRLSAGASIEILSKGAVYMISEGANVTMSCTEERFS